MRRICFTLNNYTEEDVERITAYIRMHAKYGIFGKEVGEETHTPHLQGYINLRKPKRFKSIKDGIGHRAHIEAARGSDRENRAYCSKGIDIFEHGEIPKQGSRSDLHRVVESIKKKASKEYVAENHPIEYIKYGRGIDNYIKVIKSIKQRDFKTEVHFYWGPTGTGKSKKANEEANKIGTVYHKPRGEWWDGYEQQDCVIMDDFYGWIPYDELLRLCDRYPYRVPVKGGYEIFNSKHIFITSNKPIDELYKFNNFSPDPLKRRIEDIIEFK
ncbi:replication associated protein [Calfel virus LSF17_cyc102]|uniref:Replication-associated protein n=1 Tax=Calfel virus LSF17_cyc102 TaxID=2951256 RepID=A0AAX3BQ25_9CIRC|nr:replication associated protein [Calfel virus LSF17_cyc102]UUG66199.1 replication associated protein [Calfel virus LSF17_cyc102]